MLVNAAERFAHERINLSRAARWKVVRATAASKTGFAGESHCLILGGPLRMIDNQDLNLASFHFQFEAKLLLQSRED